MAYLPKDSEVQDRYLKVVELAIPFLITGSATPSLVSIQCDEPSLLFFNTAGVTQCTYADGAFDSAAEQSSITFASPSDSAGTMNMVLRINENIVKLVSASVVVIGGPGDSHCTFPTGSTLGLTSQDNKFVFNVTTGVDIATPSNLYAALIVRYVVSE
jgi:hypothetical protein